MVDMGIVAVLTKIGELFQRTYFCKLLFLAAQIISSLFRHQGNRRATFSTFLAQTFFTGVEAVPQIALLAIVVGVLTIMQAVTVMPKLGGGDALGGVMVAVVIRELGPLMTALFIAGRTGSAMSTYIGNMKVLQEIDALKAMGIDPLHFLIMPTFFATLLSMFGLTMIFNFVAVLGGYFIVWMMNVVVPGIFSGHLSFVLYMEKVFEAMGIMDVVLGVLKPFLFGTFISVIACFHGMSVGLDIRAVPRGTRMAVVRSFVMIIVCDLALAIPFFLQLKDKIIL